jgi:hypothetical protein
VADLGGGPEREAGEGDVFGVTSERPSAPATPRWVKMFGIVGLVLLLVIAFILITGLGGPHGPARHGAWDDAVWQPPFGPGGAAGTIVGDTI